VKKREKQRKRKLKICLLKKTRRKRLTRRKESARKRKKKKKILSLMMIRLTLIMERTSKIPNQKRLTYRTTWILMTRNKRTILKKVEKMSQKPCLILKTMKR